MNEKCGFDLSGTLQDRGKTHGDINIEAELCDKLMRCFEEWDQWYNLDPVKRHCLRMICVKAARATLGDSNFKDHWHDIQGYARLVEEQCHDDG